MLAAHSVCLFTTWGNLIRRQNHDEIERADLQPAVWLQTLVASVR
jgi:hypothetical protein